jgi:hypothetical protein
LLVSSPTHQLQLLLIVNFQREIPQHLSFTTPTTRTDTRRHRRRRVIRHLGPDGGCARRRAGQLDAGGNIYVGVDKRRDRPGRHVEDRGREGPYLGALVRGGSGLGLWDHPERVGWDHHARVAHGPDRDQTLRDRGSGGLDRRQSRGLRHGVVYVHEFAVRRSFSFLGGCGGGGGDCDCVGGSGGGDFEGAADGYGDGGDGAGAGGLDDGLFGVFKEPPDGLAVGLVTEFAGQLEDPGGAGGWYSDPPTTTLHLCMPVLRGRPPRRRHRHRGGDHPDRLRGRHRREGPVGLLVLVRVRVQGLLFQRHGLQRHRILEACGFRDALVIKVLLRVAGAGAEIGGAPSVVVLIHVLLLIRHHFGGNWTVCFPRIRGKARARLWLRSEGVIETVI